MLSQLLGAQLTDVSHGRIVCRHVLLGHVDQDYPQDTGDSKDDRAPEETAVEACHQGIGSRTLKVVGDDVGRGRGGGDRVQECHADCSADLLAGVEHR